MDHKDKAISAKRDQHIYSDSSPLNRSIASQMSVDFVVNQDGDVWMLHDKPLPGILRWAEYDFETEQVTLTTIDGDMYELGMDIPADMGNNIRKAMQITVMLIENKKITDFAMVPILTRESIN